MRKHQNTVAARPVFLNLRRIELPVGALTSILHRIAGVCLAMGVPFAVYLLDLSLHDPQAFTKVTGLFSNLAFKAATVFLIWAVAHHILAGVRHLLSDVDVGSTLYGGRRSAWQVNMGGLALLRERAGLVFQSKMYEIESVLGRKPR